MGERGGVNGGKMGGGLRIGKRGWAKGAKMGRGVRVGKLEEA